METTATAQLPTHQSAGDVIGCVNGAGLMRWGRIDGSAVRSSDHPPPSASPSTPLRAAGSLSLSPRADGFDLTPFLQWRQRHFGTSMGGGEEGRERSLGDR